jgi:hypothetical protein
MSTFHSYPGHDGGSWLTVDGAVRLKIADSSHLAAALDAWDSTTEDQHAVCRGRVWWNLDDAVGLDETTVCVVLNEHARLELPSAALPDLLLAVRQGVEGDEFRRQLLEWPTDDVLIAAAAKVYFAECEANGVARPDQPAAGSSTVERIEEGWWRVRLRNVNGHLASVLVNYEMLME